MKLRDIRPGDVILHNFGVGPQEQRAQHELMLVLDCRHDRMVYVHVIDSLGYEGTSTMSSFLISLIGDSFELIVRMP